MSQRLLVAAFADDQDLLGAVGEARARGYPIVDAYTPYPVHGLDGALGLAPSRLGWVCFLCGATGVALALWLQYWTLAIDWPVNVGGRPFNSWPAYVPVAFEVMVLLAGFGVVLAFLGVSRLYPGKSPQLPDLRVTDDRFLLVVEATGPATDTEEVLEVFRSHGAVTAEEREPPTAPGTPDRGYLRPLNWVLLGLLILVVGLNWWLGEDLSRPNQEFMPEMVHGPGFRSYSAHPDLPNQETMQPPQEGTIARGQMPLHYAPTPADAERAGRELSNPYALNDTQRRQRGAVVYSQHCLVCHGPQGKGDGPVTLRGVPPPPSLLLEKPLKLKDGQLFHIITHGQGNMAAYAGQVPLDERWAIILHIRHLQKPSGAAP